MESSNPVLNDKVFQQGYARDIDGGVMTVNGCVNKSYLLLGLMLIPAVWAWSKVSKIYSLMNTDPELAMQQAGTLRGLFIASIAAGIGGFIIAIVLMFKKEWAKVLAPVYALLQGLLVGGISATYEMQFPGIVMNAAGLTIAVFLCLLSAYKMGLIKVTRGFQLGMGIALAAIGLIYLVNIVATMFGHPMPMIHSNGWLGIGFSLFVVGIAALSLILDFDFFEKGSQAGLPKHMEWYAAFGLLVTLIWLYMEILRLLAKLRGRD